MPCGEAPVLVRDGGSAPRGVRPPTPLAQRGRAHPARGRGRRHRAGIGGGGAPQRDRASPIPRLQPDFRHRARCRGPVAGRAARVASGPDNVDAIAVHARVRVDTARPNESGERGFGRRPHSAPIRTEPEFSKVGRRIPNAVDETTIGESLAAQQHIGLGDHIEAASLAPFQLEQVQRGEQPGAPAGPSVRLRVVGIVRRPLDLGDLGASGGVVIETPAFDRAYAGKIASFVERVAHPDCASRRRRQVHHAAARRHLRTKLENSTDLTCRIARWAGRHQRADRRAVGVCRCCRARRRGRDLHRALPRSVACGAEPNNARRARPHAARAGNRRRTPVGRDRRRRRDPRRAPRNRRVADLSDRDRAPGRSRRPASRSTRACCSSVPHASIGIRRPGRVARGERAPPVPRRTNRHRARHPAADAADVGARAGLRPSVTNGFRMALEPGRGANALPVRSALLGAVLGLVGVSAALVFASSLGHLESTPHLYGWSWNFKAPDDTFSERCDTRDFGLTRIEGVTDVAGRLLHLGADRRSADDGLGIHADTRHHRPDGGAGPRRARPVVRWRSGPRPCARSTRSR